MTLYLFEWPDRAALLVDDVDEKSALEVAMSDSDGTAPTRGRALPPRVFAVDLVVEAADDDPEVDELRIEALPHVADALLGLLEDADDPIVPVCCSEADGDGGELVRCELLKGHVGDHLASGGGLRWSGL